MTDADINPKAILILERGVKALQKNNYKQAANAFTSLLEKFPGERALRDKALGFLKTCERLTAAKPKEPTDGQEILRLATFHLNRREFDEALTLLEKAKRKTGLKPETTYAFASYHALRGEQEEALTALAEAIELDPTCKFSARSETDFAELSELEQFKELVG
jgi:tetratricopeptide (TPR) repeat protein